MRVIIYGDSITEGYWDYKKGGWAQRLRLDFWKRYPYELEVMNYGISAHTSQHVIKNFKNFFRAVSKRQVWKEKDSIIIIAIWINDSARYVSDKRKKQVASAVFKQNLEALARSIESEELIKHCLFIWPTKVIEKKTNKDDAEFWYYNSDIESYSAIIEDFCRMHNFHFLEMFHELKKADLKIDGLHPNSSGHKKIYKKVKKYIAKHILVWQK